MTHKRKNRQRLIEKKGQGPKERRGHVNGIVAPPSTDYGSAYKSPNPHRRRPIVSGAVRGIGRPKRGKNKRSG